MLEVVEICF